MSSLMARIRTRLVLAMLNRWSTPRDAARFAFRRYRDRTALITATGTLTYAELQDRTLRLVGAMAEHSVGKGDPIVGLLTDDHERIEVGMAAWESGAVLTQLNLPITVERLREVLAVSRPRVIVCDRDISPELRQALSEAASTAAIWTTGEEYEAQLAQHEPRPSRQPLSADDPMALGFTSGTTGTPKTMVVNQGTSLISMRMIVRHIGIGRQAAPEIMVVGVPLAGAGSGTVLPTMLSGGTLIIPERYTAPAIAAAVARHHASRLFVTPSLLIDLLDLSPDEYDFSSIRNIIYGSEQLPAAKLEEAIDRFGPVLQQGYGSSEVLPPLAMLPADEHVVDGRTAPRSVLSSSGRIVPPVQVRIIDKSGATLPTGQPGLIEVRSPTAFNGYLNRPDLNAEVFRDGWFRMGDVGFLGSDGLLHVLGRATDVIERNGHTTYPRHVEEVVHDHPAVKETAYVQVGEHAVLALSLRRAARDDTATGRPDLDTIEKEIRQLLEERNVPEDDRPDRVEIFDELPRSLLAKVLRREVREFITKGKS